MANQADIAYLEKERQERIESQRRLDLKCAGFPYRFVLATLAGYHVEADAQRNVRDSIAGYIETWPERYAEGRNLILTGPVGTGKTHLACALIRGVIERYGSRARYERAGAISDQVRRSYDGPEVSREQILAQLARANLLVVDEVGNQPRTEHERGLFYEILNARYERVLPTVLISNHTPAQFGDWLDPRSMDRIWECCDILTLGWQSMRQRAKAEGWLPDTSALEAEWERICASQ